MKIAALILSLALLSGVFAPPAFTQSHHSPVRFDFYGDTIAFDFDPATRVEFNGPLSADNIQSFYEAISKTNYQPIVSALLNYKEEYKPDDWLFYQLIRKTAQQISPKAENYERYTLYKWFFLSKSGYDATLAISANRILFYVQSDENIYNIPFRVCDGKQYVCLNYHDYGSIDFDKEKFTGLAVKRSEAQKAFSYKVTSLPGFTAADYEEKDISFNYYQTNYHFKVKLNPQVKTIFANYPVVDYASYFNIPLSQETYRSLIPSLKKNIKGMNTRNGVDYLMRFTRYAFLFEKDADAFGKEKRMSPEETLLYGQSDCEDRAALFFYLVKEIYNLPMIVLAYPKHVTIAVKFDKPIGHAIVYNGSKYSVCEPTPQRDDLQVGQLLPDLKKSSYEVVYAYNPQNH
ncbi:hypothetical protein [Terrimonas alba]|uniref:hypothetical protein n=1 Tax=Terrimonas alba TaxID=3349636 RepID=UPI0035F2FF12